MLRRRVLVLELELALARARALALERVPERVLALVRALARALALERVPERVPELVLAPEPVPPPRSQLAWAPWAPSEPASPSHRPTAAPLHQWESNQALTHRRRRPASRRQFDQRATPFATSWLWRGLAEPSQRQRKSILQPGNRIFRVQWKHCGAETLCSIA